MQEAKASSIALQQLLAAVLTLEKLNWLDHDGHCLDGLMAARSGSKIATASQSKAEKVNTPRSTAWPTSITAPRYQP